MQIEERTFSTKDVCNLLNANRSYVNTCFKTVFPFNKGQSDERVARKLTAKDLVYFSLLHRLEQDFGLKKKYIENISEELYNLIPLLIEKEGEIGIWISPKNAHCKAVTVNESWQEGFFIRATPSTELVLSYLGLNFDKQLLLELAI